MNIEYKITLWALACIYAIGNSFIYSWTFWSSFNINILQFVSFSEVIPSILYTVLIPCGIMILMFTSINHWDKNHPPKNNNNNELTGNKSKIKKTSFTLFKVLFVIGIFYNFVQELNSLKNMFSTDKDLFWVTIRTFIGITIVYAATDFIDYKTNFLLNFKTERRLIITILCIIPFICNVWAETKSYNIIHGKDTLLVQSDTQCNSTSKTKYRYISSISEKAFALSLTDGSICVFKYNYLKLTQEKNDNTKSSKIIDKN